MNIRGGGGRTSFVCKERIMKEANVKLLLLRSFFKWLSPGLILLYKLGGLP